MKQHPLCTDTEHCLDVMDLAVPDGIEAGVGRAADAPAFSGPLGKGAGMGGGGQPARRPRTAGRCACACLRQPAVERTTLKLPHFAPKAKRAIYLFMSGGPSQVDLLDYKPNLAALYDKDIPDSVRGAQQLTGMTTGQARFPIAPSHWAFKRYGETGTWVSDLLPYTARMVDDLTIIKSTNTEAINHEPAIMLMNTGNMNAGKPCLGSWLAYGLGSMNDNLPTFMVLQSKLNTKENNQPVSSRLWSSGFLSSEYAGVGLRSAGDPVLYLTDPEWGGPRGAPQDARCSERDQSADI